MKTKQIATIEPDAQAIEQTLISGDLSKLTIDQRLNYYNAVCKSLNLNPLTKPFEYITLNGKLTLYARKDCTEQLRKVYNVSLKIVMRESTDGCYIVTANAKLPSGREDESIGAVNIEHTKGDARANQMMKAETKAKRRVTLSICGLGMVDESEVEDITYFDATPTAEHNVKQATANRLEDRGEAEDKIDLTPRVVVEEAVTAENFGAVICHVGKPEGQLLGKKVSDIPQKLLEWLRDKWVTKLMGNVEGKDARLAKAIEFALKPAVVEQEAEQATDETPPETKEPTASPSASPELTPMSPSPLAVFDWREEKIPFKCKIKDQPLGLQDAGTMLAIKSQLIDRHDWAKATIEEKKFKAAFEVAAFELGFLLTKEQLVIALTERADDLVLTESQLCALLKKEGVFTNEEKLDDASEELLRFIYQPKNWQTVKDVVADKKPTAKKTTKKKEAKPAEDRRSAFPCTFFSTK